MKLFQKLLVAGASASLLAPMAVQASDVMKLNPSTLDSNSFTNNQVEDIENLKSIVKELQSKIDELDGLQPNQSEFEAGSFSTTTSMDGKAIFWVGGIEGISDIDDDEDVSFGVENHVVKPNFRDIGREWMAREHNGKRVFNINV